MPNTSDQTIIGIDSRFFVANLRDIPNLAVQMGLATCCPDFGTVSVCLNCQYADAKALDDCKFKCKSCEYRYSCPCSLDGWLKRQEAKTLAITP